MMRRGDRKERRGVATVIGGLMILGVILVSVMSIVAMETSYQVSGSLRDTLENRKRAENFFMLSSSLTGDKVEVFNDGPNLLHIIAVYVNHRLTANVSVYIQPTDSQLVSTGTTMLNGDAITVLSDLGNRASATFPIVTPGTSLTVNNKYVGYGPLGITFSNWSFAYQTASGNRNNCVSSTNQTAWGGVPGSIQPLFWVALISHARGNITLLNSSVLNLQTISDPNQDVKGYFIVAPSSTPCRLIQYSSRAPYFIPSNPLGDLASGGAPIMVGFGATNIDSTSLGPNLWNNAKLAAVFLSVIFVWDYFDDKGVLRHEVYSEDIPFATLRTCGGVCT